MENSINTEKWTEEPAYEWGKIYRLKDEFRKDFNGKEGLIYTDKDYWFVGSFDKRGINHEKYTEQIAKKDFGLKYWEFKKDGAKNHQPKIQKNSIEYNFILEGKIRGVIGKDEVVLRAGDFVVIMPGYLINLQEEVFEDTKGITIKNPLIDKDEIKIK